ncbi:peregrin isoform X2 [Pyrus x bretschneideri]|uniref:peregrin isoform X2 n=1 Tax=Pyrus x bretschneideri TaxID=225117 RepID=UPI00202F9E10|nr:peregrin isoform X2 [Pyrus x bretschneideri]
MTSDGNRRKSARLLDAESKGKKICYAEEDVSSEEDDSCQTRRRKKVQIGPVQDPAASRNENKLKTKVDNTHAGDAAMPSETPLPESWKLELLLSFLRNYRKDSYNMFAKPVNPQEVKGYNDIIKEPMDFGTISEKLSAGSYRTLEEFQHDVYLVSANAMSYNPPSSIFNREARDIKIIADELFGALKNDLKSFESVRSSKTSRAGMRSKNITNSSADRSTNGMPSRAQGVAEQKLQKAEVLNPQFSTSNFQRRDLDLNVALSHNGINNSQSSNILLSSTPTQYCGAQTNVGRHNGQFIGTLPSIKASFNSSIGTDVGRGRGPVITNLPASELRRQFEKVYGPSPSSSRWCCPQGNSSWTPAFCSTLGLNSNCSGGEPRQFQPMGGRGCTPYGTNSSKQASEGLNRLRPAQIGPQRPVFQPFEQQGQGWSTPTSGSQGLNPLRPAEIGPRRPVFQPFQQQEQGRSTPTSGSQGLYRLRPVEIGPRRPVFQPFQQQGQGRSTPTSGTSMRPINLSDVDQWFGHHWSGGVSNTGAPPASSQGLGAAETNMFPLNSPHSGGSNTGAPPASSQGCD